MSGEELKEKLSRKGYSITTIAKMIGTSQQNLSRALTADSVKTSLLEDLCVALDMKINDFYKDTPYAVKTEVAEMIQGYDSTAVVQKLLDKLNTKDEEIAKSNAYYREVIDNKDETIDRLYRETVRLAMENANPHGPELLPKAAEQ